MDILKSDFKINKKRLLEFAEISGDWNPIHYDEEISRRYKTERPIIHGILTLIEVLNIFLKDNSLVISSIKCNFLKPIYPDYKYQLYIENQEGNSKNFYLFDQQNLLFNCNLSYKNASPKIISRKFLNEPNRDYPLSKNFEEINGSKGKLKLLVKFDSLKSKYIHLFKSLSSDSIVSLINTSRLVGMECPGLNSLFSTISVIFTQDNLKSHLYWKVNSISQKFLPINIRFESSGLKGDLKVFYREPPVNQITTKDLRKRYKKQIFIKKKVLVIGGSRGIGELTTKLLSIRDADITLTFNKGEKDAKRVLNEIYSYGTKVNALHLDILNHKSIRNIFQDSPNFDQIYFFASPRIVESTNNKFDFKLFEKYNSYYISPLLTILNLLNQKNKYKTKIFFPSTIFLNEINHESFSEYKASKLACESITKQISLNKNISIIYERLPRILTDQTADLNKKLLTNGIEVLNNTLDKMYI